MAKSTTSSTLTRARAVPKPSLVAKSKKPVILSAVEEGWLKEILDEGQALVDSTEIGVRRFSQLVVRRAFSRTARGARVADF